MGEAGSLVAHQAVVEVEVSRTLDLVRPLHAGRGAGRLIRSMTE
jgi:hypothetical protein